MSTTLRVAIARAWAVAKKDFHRAIAILRAAGVQIDAAIALAARFFGAHAARAL